MVFLIVSSVNSKSWSAFVDYHKENWVIPVRQRAPRYFA